MIGMVTFVTYPPELVAASWLINAGLIGVAWWLSHQLTYSCTYIDEKAEVGYFTNSASTAEVSTPASSSAAAQASTFRSTVSRPGNRPNGVAPRPASLG